MKLQSNGHGTQHGEEIHDLLRPGVQKGHHNHEEADHKGHSNGTSINAAYIPVKKELGEGTDENGTPSERPQIALAVIDHVICGFVVAPLVIAFWWSTWDLLDLVVFPDNHELSYWVCIAAGGIFNGFAYCLQEWTLRRAQKANLVESIILHRAYAFVFGASTVSLWRGVWDCWDHYSGITAVSVASSIIIGLLTLIPLRAFRAAKSPPLFMCNDLENEGFDCTSRFTRKFKEGKVLYILDNLFTAWIIHPLYVTLWRGVWTTMDLIIYPEDITKSIWVTLAFGYPLTVLCYLLQIPSFYLYELITNAKLSVRTSVLCKILVDDIVHVFVHIATIAVWRGWWELYVHYIPGSGGTLRLYLSSIVSFLILSLMMTANSVLGHGCEVDGEEGPAPFFYIKYTRYFKEIWQKKMTKKKCTEEKGEKQSVELMDLVSEKTIFRETAC